MSRLAAQAKMQFYPTQEEILKYVELMIDSSKFNDLLDPCAGDGSAINYLKRVWYTPPFAVEPNNDRYAECVRKFGRSNCYNEFFEDVKASNFSLAFVNPPYNNRREISWLRMVASAMKDDATVIWILPQGTIKNEHFIEKFAALYYDAEVWKYPDKLFEDFKQYVIRARVRKFENASPSLTRSQEFARAVEEYKTLGEHHINKWANIVAREPRVSPRVVRKDLAWEDVFIELMEAWKRMPYIESSLLRNYLQKVKDEPDADHSIPPDQILHDGAQAWVVHSSRIDKDIMMIEFIGRRNAIEAIEAQLKRGKSVKYRRGRYETRAKFMGGATSYKENYLHFMTRLPIGLFHSVWIHKNATPDPVKDCAYAMVSESNIHKAYMAITKICGLSLFPEWFDWKLPDGVRRAVGSTTYYLDTQNIRVDRLGIMSTLRTSAMAKKANEDPLPDPEPLNKEEVSPLMPLSTNNYAQLVLHGDTNNYPMQIGDDKFVMYAQQISDRDVEVGEHIDGRTEVTTIYRTDASRVTVFHYAGPKTGEWEIYESGVDAKAPDITDQEVKDEYKPAIA